MEGGRERKNGRGDGVAGGGAQRLRCNITMPTVAATHDHRHSAGQFTKRLLKTLAFKARGGSSPSPSAVDVGPASVAPIGCEDIVPGRAIGCEESSW